MNADIIQWAIGYLTPNGYVLTSNLPEIVQNTPWSTVIRFVTTKGIVYLKETPEAISLEPKIIQLLANQLHARVPTVIATNDDLHCFLMDDAGPTLRTHLKDHFQPELLCQAICEFTTIQRSTENHLNDFFTLGVPDWRLNQLPTLYDQLINQTAVLKSEGMADEELKLLHDLSGQCSEQCALLGKYPIKETLVQPDFNTNNMLFNPVSKKMTLIDLGEIAITHPFFSLHNFLLQATIHHGIKEQDQFYHQLQETCLESWLMLTTKESLHEVFTLSKKIWPIYAALAHHRLMMSVNLDALKSYYPGRPSQLVSHLREYMATS